MDVLNPMQVLVAVIEHGSFVRAAESLSVSKATVSRQISQLEARLGVRLLHRTTRKLSPTEEGEVFYARCKTIMTDIEAAEAEVSERRGEAVGLLRVNAPLSFGILHLAERWGTFKALHPRVSLDITLGDRVVDLVEDGYDLAVRIGRLPDSSLVSRRLATTRLVLCASPRYLAQAGPPAHPDELTRHEILAYHYSDRGDDWSFLGPEGEVTVRVRPRMRTNNGDTCRVGALLDQGIVLQPTFIVGPDLEAGRLVEILPEYRSREIGIYAVYPTRKHVAPKVRLMIDFLVESFRSPSWIP